MYVVSVINTQMRLYYIVQLSILHVGLLIFSASCILAIIGLYQMKKWGRYLALLIGLSYITIGLVVIVYGLLAFPLMGGSHPDMYVTVIITTIGLVAIIIGIAIFWYLMRDVKYEFK